MYDERTRAAAARAADWLEDHPDQHIGYMMAADATTGEAVPVAMADDTCCFCAVGRLARELGVPSRDIGPNHLGSTETDSLIGENDMGFAFSGDEDSRGFAPPNHIGRQNGLKALRRIAKGERP